MGLIERIMAWRNVGVTEEPVAAHTESEINRTTASNPIEKNETNTSLERLKVTSDDTATSGSTPTAESGAIANETSAVTEADLNRQNDIKSCEKLTKGNPSITDPKSCEGIDGSAQEEDVEDESRYPTGASLALLTFGLCMAIFVVCRASFFKDLIISNLLLFFTS
jgi:hypothetical protein